MDSIPFVVETESHRLPIELLQKRIIRTKTLTIQELKQNDRSTDRLFIGLYSGLGRADKPERSEETEAFFDELADVYLEIYGNVPWNEFLSCSKEKCLGRKNISDIHKVPLQERISLRQLETEKPTRPKDHACPICGSPMKFYYPPGKVRATIESEFNREVVAVFLFNQYGRIEGFSWAWFSTIDVIVQKLVTQHKCSIDSSMITATESFFENSGREQMLYLSEWAVSYVYRNTAIPLLLLSYITFLGKERALALGDSDPVFIGVSVDGSSATNAYRRFGASTVFRDPKTNIVVLGTSIQRALVHYKRVECALTKRLLRHKRRRSADSVRYASDKDV